MGVKIRFSKINIEYNYQYGRSLEVAEYAAKAQEKERKMHEDRAVFKLARGKLRRTSADLTKVDHAGFRTQSGILLDSLCTLLRNGSTATVGSNVAAFCST